MSSRDVGGILRKAGKTLAYAREGLADLGPGPDISRQESGLARVAVFGRSVSLVLQTLRSVDPDRFDRWYEPHQGRLIANAGFRFLVSLRNEILKEGPPELERHGTLAIYPDTSETVSDPHLMLAALYLRDRPADDLSVLCYEYIEALAGILDDAEREFCST